MADPKPQKFITNDLPADSETLTAAMEFVLRMFKVELDQLLPARVVAFDRKLGRVNVKPIIHWVDMNDQEHPRPAINNVPVFTFGAGNMHINFPVKAGDLGWIFACDRDISLFKQSMKEGMPNTGRLHSFSDAVFFPDVMRQYQINPEDADALVIQTTDASTRISVKPGQIKVTAPTKFIVDSPMSEFTGAVKMDSTLEVVGDAKINGIQFTPHEHTTTEPGKPTAGGAQNG
ncbi:putative baseplate protein [Pseudomonas phage tabernarius]|uniref:Putative baseplate protein n=1 Tax=Pseudomonas phage tabernarius TaxID=2048978 RepID=A0A2H4P6V3_9CAUD|nr:baseplate spike [Pseudomonas phage tabernarius]ATW57902.1 putative baseplate protein [Pseudomonas phage tabernarius]